MDRKLRNRTLLFLALAAVVAFALVRLSGRQPVAKISATTPVRQNIVSSVSSNGKVEPISPYTIRAELDTFVEKVLASEGQNVKKGQLLLRLDVKDATSQLAAAKARLLRAQDELRSAQAGGRMKRHGSTGTSRKHRRNWIGDNAIMIRSNACERREPQPRMNWQPTIWLWHRRKPMSTS